MSKTEIKSALKVWLSGVSIPSTVRTSWQNCFIPLPEAAATDSREYELSHLEFLLKSFWAFSEGWPSIISGG